MACATKLRRRAKVAPTAKLCAPTCHFDSWRSNCTKRRFSRVAGRRWTVEVDRPVRTERSLSRYPASSSARVSIMRRARSTDCTPPSRGSGLLLAWDFGSISLRWITFFFIATCIHPEVKRPVRCSISKIPLCLTIPQLDAAPDRPKRPVAQALQQARAARPFVLGPQHLDRQFCRVGIGRDAVLVEILGGLLDLDVARERGDHRLDEALGLHLLLHLHHVAGKHHRRGNDGVPVAEDQ